MAKAGGPPALDSLRNMVRLLGSLGVLPFWVVNCLKVPLPVHHCQVHASLNQEHFPFLPCSYSEVIFWARWVT